MEIIKKLDRDKLYKIVIGIYDNCHEYLLTDANNNNDIYAILEEEEINLN